jgi:RNA polymerase sigma-70 factor (ECF subfamily)
MSDERRKRFSLRIEPYLDKLYRAAYRLTQRRAEAEELFQDTCVRAYSMRDSWEAAQSPLGWLMRVQYNLFIDGIRKNNRSVVVPIGDVEDAGSAAGGGFDPETCANDARRFAIVHEAWTKLKRDQQALLALRVEGYTLPEIQEITGLEVTVINSRLQRARQSLARHLRSDVPDAPQKAEPWQ